MKKIISTLFFVIIQTIIVFGQCCPYLGTIKIIPDNPTSIDSIYLVMNVTTPCLGEYLGCQINDSGTLITVEACYYSGDATQPENYTDTINLGLKNVGIYNLNFIAFQSSNQTNCNHEDTNSIQIGFEVTANNSIEIFTNEINIDYFPNPTTGKIKVQAEGIKKAEVMNMQGRIVFTGNENYIDLSNQTKGIYIIKITTNKGVAVEKVVLE